MIPARRKGWIGVDIGARSVKLAQVERVGAELRLSEAVVIQRRFPINADHGEETPPATSEDEIRTALSLGERFSGRKAACILSMSLCDLRALDVPRRNEAQQRLAIADQMKSVYARGATDREFDFWHTNDPGNEPQSDLENVSVLSVSQEWMAQVADDLGKAGLRCETLDGLPLALARVIQMVPSASNRTPVAVVDWGFASTTFCLVIDGSPAFVRCLRGCGLSSVTQSLCEELAVSLDEAQRLLTRHGIPDSSHSKETRDELQLVIGDVVTQPLNAIVHELNRTLSYFKAQRPALLPDQIWLSGGGAAVKNIADFLGTRIGVPVDVLRLANAGIQKRPDTEYPSGILTPAISASSLAWGEQ